MSRSKNWGLGRAEYRINVSFRFPISGVAPLTEVLKKRPNDTKYMYCREGHYFYLIVLLDEVPLTILAGGQ